MDTIVYEPKATVGLDLAVAANIIQSRKVVSAPGVYEATVTNQPNLVRSTLEGSPFEGQDVYLVNIGLTTPDLKAKAEELLSLAIDAAEAGDMDRAMLIAQDAASNSIVQTLTESKAARWLPNQGETIRVTIGTVIPENGPNAGKRVLRSTSISQAPIKEAKTSALSTDSADRLAKLGIKVRGTKSSVKDDSAPDDEPALDENGNPIVE